MANDKSGGGKDATHDQFNKAHDGKVVPQQSEFDPTVTKQQTRSYEKLQKVTDKPASKGKAGEVASARAAYHFNVDAVQTSEKSTVLPKKEAQKKRAYISKESGKEYTSKKAVEAAKAQDKALADKKAAQKKEQQKKEEQKKQEAAKSRHPAPAPKLQGGPANGKNGVSIKNNQQKANEVPKTNSYQATAERIKKNQQLQKSQDKSKDKSKGQDKGIER